MTGSTAGNSGEVADAAVDTVLSGRYRLESRLGGGATATVWRANDLDTGAAVAVKVLGPWAVAPELAMRFEREAAILELVSHPNLVSVRDTGNHDGRPFLVMDLVEGVSLRAILNDGPVPVDRAIELAAEVAAGLGAAHAAGIVHRDVKPANIVCDDDGGPHVVDFGIARADDLTSVTRTHSVLGTVAYLSPEQARGEVAGAPTDVYALGCVLYELLTGRPPFEAASAVAVAYRHVHDEPVRPSLFRPEVPSAVDAVVLRCLAKAPGERYANGAELEAALRALDDGGGGEATVVAAPVASGDTQVLPAVDATVAEPATPAHHWRLIAAAGVAAFVIAFVFAALAGGGGGEPPARADTSTTTVATTTTTVVTTTTAAPVATDDGDDEGEDHPGKGKGRGKDDD